MQSNKTIRAVMAIVAMMIGRAWAEANPADSGWTPEPAVAEAPGDGWTTVATLRSDDPAWQDLPGLLVSAPFSADGEVRIVLDMPEAGPMDGVIVAAIPADQATDPASLLSAVRSGVTVILMASAPEQNVVGLAGECVLMQSVPTAKPWSLEVQTRP